MTYSTYSLLFFCSFVISHLFSLICTTLSLCTQNWYFPLIWSEKGEVWRVKKWWWSELFTHSHQAIQFIHVTDLHIAYVFIFNTLLITNAFLVWELEIIWLGLGNKTTVLGLEKNKSFETLFMTLLFCDYFIFCYDALLNILNIYCKFTCACSDRPWYTLQGVSLQTQTHFFSLLLSVPALRFRVCYFQENACCFLLQPWLWLYECRKWCLLHSPWVKFLWLSFTRWVLCP